jgi:Protein of unknown function (DUF2934)
MARKTTGNGTGTRSKKTTALVPPPDVQTTDVQAAPEVRKEARKNGKPASQVPVNLAVNLEDEIRRRAYELYLQRRATAGGENGNQNQDWLVAEREIRLRHGEHHTA